jgi:hypothetical protein
MILVNKFVEKHSWLLDFPIHIVVITVHLDMSSFFSYITVLSEPVSRVVSVASVLLNSTVVIYVVNINFA